MFKTAATILAGLTLATAGLSGAASATTLTVGQTGPITSSGGLCVGDAGNSTKVGTPVVLWSCINDASQKWTPASDGTLRVHGATGQCVSPDVNGKLVLGACGSPAAISWLPRGDHTVSGSSDLQSSHKCMIASSLTRGASVEWGTCSTSPSERFTVPSTRYASTALSYRPDSGGGGDNWALDTMTRRASITWQGGTTYVGSVVDSGSFVTVPGNLTPNQGAGDKGNTLGDSLVGSVAGASGYHFTATGYSSTSRVPAKVQGVGTTGTGDWMKWFFPASSTFGGAGMDNSGPDAWSWSYRGTDNCNKAETWTDSYTHSGQDASDGDILAPAPGHC